MIKATKRDTSGVSPHKENGKRLADTTEKENSINRQFQSIFTSETQINLHLF